MSSIDVARLVFGYLSEQGLEETKRAFSKESKDLEETDIDIDLNQGRTLSLIVEEYFLLKLHEKKTKPTNPEAVLLLLWKQFDVLVGQLKHSTIHSAKEKVVKGLSKQAGRVRQMNRQNWATLQQRTDSKTTCVPKPKNGTIKTLRRSLQTKSQPAQNIPTSSYDVFPALHNVSHSSQYVPQSPHNAPPSSQDVLKSPQRVQASSGPNAAPVFKTPVKSAPNDGDILQNAISECVEEVEIDSSKQLQSNNEQVSTDQFRSPKRKSVPPKKRTGEVVTALSPAHAQVSTKTNVSTSQEEAHLDLQNLVDKILGRPELPEKLAENINRAVEIDGAINQQSDNDTEDSNHTQNVVVDGNKINDIVDMMKSDPVFEELFSSFENFENSCEDIDGGQGNESEEQRLSQPSSMSCEKDDCASEALDALLLLASSPVPAVSLDTPQKGVTSSPLVTSTNSLAVAALSPGSLDPTTRSSQTIVSHVRQLNFSGTTSSIPELKSPACERSTSPGTHPGADINVCAVPGIEPKETIAEVESDHDKISPNGNECPEGVMSQENDSEGQSFEVTSESQVLWNETEKREVKLSEELTGYVDSPSKLRALKDLATNELLDCQSQTIVEDTKRTPSKSAHEAEKGTLDNSVSDKECNRTIDMIACDSTVAEDMRPLTESLRDFTNLRTPERDEVSTSESLETSKRKKKKRSSSRMAKKAKIIPDNLDVDRFLSRLNYVREEKNEDFE